MDKSSNILGQIDRI